jgi:dihydrofolate synthase/folylpolyglutamate synthase
LPGRHQLENAGCAVAMLEAASERGLRVSEQAIRRGLRGVAWEGRLEAIEHAPLVVLDGAHNPAAASAVADYLKDFRDTNGGRVVLVAGFMRDKDYCGSLSVVSPYVDDIVLTSVQMSRAATPEELHEGLKGWPGRVHTTACSGDALSYARRVASAQDMICITGSLMLVGEIKALLRGCEVSLLHG